MGASDLGLAHPLRAAAERERARVAQHLSTLGASGAFRPPGGARPPSYASLARPDSSGGQLPNQAPAPTSYLMRQNRGDVNPIDHTDENYGRFNDPLARYQNETGGGAAGSMAAQQKGQERGIAMTQSLPPLQAMQPYVKGSQPNTAQAFAGVDRQVGQMAAREKATGHAGGGDPLIAGLQAGPKAGVAATAPAAQGKFAAEWAKDPQAGMSPDARAAFAPPAAPQQQAAAKPAWNWNAQGDQLAAQAGMGGGAKPAPAPVASIGGQVDPRLVGNRRQVQRAQNRINASNTAKQGGIAGPPALAAGVNNPPPLNPPPIPVAGIQAGMGGVAGMLKQLFGNGGPQPDEQPPSIAMMAHAKAQLDKYAGTNFADVAMANYRDTQEKAAAADERYHARVDARKRHADTTSLARRDLALREAQAANQNRLTDLEAEKVKSLLQFGPIATALMGGLGAGNTTPEQVAAAGLLHRLQTGKDPSKGLPGATGETMPTSPRAHEAESLMPGLMPDLTKIVAEDATPVEAYRRAVQRGHDLSDPDSHLSRTFRAYLRARAGEDGWRDSLLPGNKGQDLLTWILGGVGDTDHEYQDWANATARR